MAVNSYYNYMKFVTEIFKFTWNSVRDHIGRCLCSEFIR